MEQYCGDCHNMRTKSRIAWCRLGMISNSDGTRDKTFKPFPNGYLKKNIQMWKTFAKDCEYYELDK